MDPVCAARRWTPLVRISTIVWLGLTLASTPPARAQGDPRIPDVSELCADRPPVHGEIFAETRRARMRQIGDEARSRGPFGRTASDLYCIDLYPAAAGGDAVGVVELGRSLTPFGIAVTPEGYHVYDLTTWIAGLPDPRDLGPYSTYMAWATTPYLDPVVKLGAVRNGSNRMGSVAFNQFLILISAEPSAQVESRSGPLVLRGRSPSAAMEPLDLLSEAPSAVAVEEGAHDRRRPDHAGEPVGPRSWRRPPMYPDIPMLPGMRGLEPNEKALLPAADSIDRVPAAQPRQLIQLGDGATLDLEARPVRREIDRRSLILFGFNGQYPGPLIRVPQNSTIFVNFTNRTPLPSTIHWHGVRLDNRFDGVPGVTQSAVQPGATFRYRVYFRDAGIYWYHPHHREDLQQELGLYGNILVDAPPANDFGPANREEVLMLDDLLLDSEGVTPFGATTANFALMGRFGNVFLVNGEPDYRLEVRRGAVVRFFLTNASNTRTFNLSFRRMDPDADGDAPSYRTLPVKVVGSDIGKFERQVRAQNIVLAPAERYIVEARFDEPGEYALVNHVQAIDHLAGIFVPELTRLGAVRVVERSVDPDYSETFEALRTHSDVVTEIDRYRDAFDRPVDHRLALTMEVDGLPRPVEQVMLYDWIYFNPVEWAGTMPVMNWLSTGREVRWILRDADTGRENMAIDWRFRVGDVVKIRLRNERDAFHAMQHPIHIHGQRFLILTQNGVRNDNRVWKDTMLLPAGATADILLELSNPGRWMVHCHIAEHLDAGMKFVMEVADR